MKCPYVQSPQAFAGGDEVEVQRDQQPEQVCVVVRGDLCEGVVEQRESGRSWQALRGVVEVVARRRQRREQCQIGDDLLLSL